MISSRIHLVVWTKGYVYKPQPTPPLSVLPNGPLSVSGPLCVHPLFHTVSVLHVIGCMFNSTSSVFSLVCTLLQWIVCNSTLTMSGPSVFCNGSACGCVFLYRYPNRILLWLSAIMVDRTQLYFVSASSIFYWDGSAYGDVSFYRYHLLLCLTDRQTEQFEEQRPNYQFGESNSCNEIVLLWSTYLYIKF